MKLANEDAEVTIWKEVVFQVGKTFIESLCDALPRFNYAILILTPDELVSERKRQGLWAKAKNPDENRFDP